MYTTQNAFRNLIRNKKRYLLTGILLLAAFSVLVCALFHYDTAGRIADKHHLEHSSWVSVRFRSDLQYEGIPTAHSEFAGMTFSDGKKAFDPDAMAEYDHPYPMTKASFTALSEHELVESFLLLYMEPAYRTAVNEIYDALYPAEVTATSEGALPSRTPLTEFYICGGDPEAFVRSQSSNTAGSLYRFRLTEGTMYDTGECIISSSYSENNNVFIGDTLELYDLSGEITVFSARVSGIYVLESSWHYPKDPFEVHDGIKPGSSYKDTLALLGTPFDRALNSFLMKTYDAPLPSVRTNTIKHMVFTDFDTAYYLYGDENTDPYFSERHHFNKFLAWYQLKAHHDFDSFSDFFQKTGLGSKYDDQFELFDSAVICSKYSSSYNLLKKNSVPFILCSAILCGLIFFVSLSINIRERKQEIGIYWSLGISARLIAWTMAAEWTIITALSSFFAVFAAYGIHRLTEISDLSVKCLNLPYSPTVYWPAVLAVSSVLSLSAGYGLMRLYLRLYSPAAFVNRD